MSFRISRDFLLSGDHMKRMSFEHRCFVVGQRSIPKFPDHVRDIYSTLEASSSVCGSSLAFLGQKVFIGRHAISQRVGSANARASKIAEAGAAVGPPLAEALGPQDTFWEELQPHDTRDLHHPSLRHRRRLSPSSSSCLRGDLRGPSVDPRQTHRRRRWRRPLQRSR